MNTITPSVGRHYTWSGAFCLVAGSLAVLAQWLVTPVDATLSTPELIAHVADHPTAMAWALVLDVPILLVYPAVLYVGHLARAGTSLFAGVATALCFLPMLGGVLLLGGDALVFAAAGQPDPAHAAALVDAYLHSAFVGGLTIGYLVTHVIGFVLLAIALWRVRAVPVWACTALALWPIVEMGGYAVGGKVLAAVGYALLVAAYTACAAALVRESGSASVGIRGDKALAAS